jgi:hypothetical protein
MGLFIFFYLCSVILVIVRAFMARQLVGMPTVIFFIGSFLCFIMLCALVGEVSDWEQLHGDMKLDD